MGIDLEFLFFFGAYVSLVVVIFCFFIFINIYATLISFLIQIISIYNIL